MNKKIYLIATALLILGSILWAFSGWRYFLSPVSLFRIGTIMNIVLSISLGGLFVYALSLRFHSVWKGNVDVTMLAETPHALRIQNVSRWVLYSYFILLPLYIVLMFMGGSVRAEIRFLFSPLLKVLPAGYILFEIARLIDFDARLKKANKRL